MTQNHARRAALALFAIWLITAYLLYDRYPTVNDCEDVANVYLRRGLLDAMTAAEYATGCGQAQSREKRQDIVDRMNDEASFAAGRR